MSSGAAEFQSTQAKLLQLASWNWLISGCVLLLHEEAEMENLDDAV